MLARSIPKLTRNSQSALLRSFGQKMSDLINPETIVEDPDFSPELSEDTNAHNFNREEYPQYERTLELAREQRNLIEELKSNPIPPRRERRVYDRPLIDDNIEQYDVYREFSDTTLTKEYPHGLPVVCKIEVSPKDFIHCFG
jgi:hypothetical protein